MKNYLLSMFLLCAIPLFGGVDVGQQAPGFTLNDLDGNPVSLSDYEGKTVVLEWVNPGCPFVRKFYTRPDMPEFQKKAQEMGVVWLSINSTPTDHSQFMSPGDSKAWASRHGHAAKWLIDSDTTVAKAYGARTTPHMFIINPEGEVVYQGAIDSIRDSDPDSIPKATNYVMQALVALESGEPIPDQRTRPYGCTVKYN